MACHLIWHFSKFDKARNLLFSGKRAKCLHFHLIVRKDSVAISNATDSVKDSGTLDLSSESA